MTALDVYQIRPFDPERDMEGARKAFVSGFHHILWPLIDHADGLVEDIILTFHNMGVASFVAEAEGEARGILIGGLPFETRYLIGDVKVGVSFAWRWLADATVYLLLFITASGIYLWLALRSERRVGIAMLIAGAISFFGMVYALAG